MPLNIIPQNKLDPLAVAISKLYPAPNVNGNGFNFLSNPVRSETRNNFDIRLDQKYSDNDNGFFLITSSHITLDPFPLPAWHPVRFFWPSPVQEDQGPGSAPYRSTADARAAPIT